MASHAHGIPECPAIYQQRVTNALHPLIGNICHVYLDNIVIWSETLKEHIKNTRMVMQVLQDAKLYVNEKKTHLFCADIYFWVIIFPNTAFRPMDLKLPESWIGLVQILLQKSDNSSASSNKSVPFCLILQYIPRFSINSQQNRQNAAS